MSALLGRWASCRRCDGKAFAARSLQGVRVWVCIDTTHCGAQVPIGAMDHPAPAVVRFVPSTTKRESAMPSSWGLVERGPGTP